MAFAHWTQSVQRTHQNHSQAIVGMLREIHGVLHQTTQESVPKYGNSAGEDANWNERLQRLEREHGLESTASNFTPAVANEPNKQSKSNGAQSHFSNSESSDENLSGEEKGTTSKQSAVDQLYELDALNNSDSEAETVHISAKAEAGLIDR
jgi:hypothetical protein